METINYNINHSSGNNSNSSKSKSTVEPHVSSILFGHTMVPNIE